MSNQDRFPPELLETSNRNRWLYFYHKIVAHTRLADIDREVKHAIYYATQGRLILVFGPTGVGKTTLRRGLERALTGEMQPELVQDQGRMPLLSVEAVAPEQGNFDWHDFYQRALFGLNEPLVNHKVVDATTLDGQLIKQAKPNLRSLRQALEQCLRHRRPLALIIDDAHHLQKIAGSRRLLDQMDAIKSLANRSQTVLVLIGTYELLNLTNLNDQLSHRSYHVPFARYQPDCSQDVHAFKTVLQTFQQHLPLPEAPDLISRWDYFYENSAGCVGILKLWLCNSLAAALEQEPQSMTDRLLQRYAISPDRLLNIAREIREGERKWAELAEKRGQIRAALGLAPYPVSTEPEPPSRQKRRVGERRPVRDAVGG
jgi:energy-coupling factor transporter ATP-binding protein EcfA2